MGGREGMPSDPVARRPAVPLRTRATVALPPLVLTEPSLRAIETQPARC